MNRIDGLLLAALLGVPLLAGGCSRDTDPETVAPAARAADAHTPEAPVPSDDTAHDAAHDAIHEPAHGAEQDAVPPAERWQADEPLTRGMRRVRAATAALEQAGREGSDPARVEAIATELKSAVDGMFAECRLAPDADAALHPLLATVLGASRVLSAGAIDADALDDLQSVLATYDELFVDAAGNAVPE